MTFQVSTGKSASLKLQSNTSAAAGSSVGSWYGARYSCERASGAEIRVRGSNTSIFSSKSSASGSALGNLVWNGTFSLFGKDWTNRRVWLLAKTLVSHVEVRTFSEAMVWITSAGGVPSSSVMMENWLTSTISVWSCDRGLSTYGPFLGTMAFPLASLQRYILYSRYQQRHRTFAMST